MGCEYLRDMHQFFPNTFTTEQYAQSIKKRRENIVKFPDIFYAKQSIYRLEKNSIFEYFYSDNSGTMKIERKLVQIQKYHLDENRPWINPSFNSGDITLQISTNSKKQKMRVVKSASSKKRVVSKKKNDWKNNIGLNVDEISYVNNNAWGKNIGIYVDEISIAEEISEDDIYFDFAAETKIKYSIEQESLLKSYETSIESTKIPPDENQILEIDSPWFDGIFHSIDMNDTCNAIIGQKKKKMLKFHERKENNQLIYTAKLSGKWYEVFVSAADSTKFQCGFCGYYKTGFIKKDHLVAYYNSKANALKAVQLRCITQNIFTSDLHKEDKLWFEDYINKAKTQKKDKVVLYEIISKEKKLFGILFFGDKYLSQLMVPSDEAQFIYSEWQQFYFKKQISFH